jgi:competence protein ComEA
MKEFLITEWASIPMLSRLMTRREQFILAFLALSIALGSLALILKADEPAVDSLQSQSFPQVTETRSSIVVALEGAVAQPGVYDFADGDRVEDAIQKAGGLLEGADVSLINRAARLMDGTTLTIPQKDDQGINISQSYLKEHAKSQNTPPQSDGTNRININTATQAILETLPGVGPTYATAILTYRSERPFQSIEDLKKVEGVGPKRYEALKDLITVQ